MNLLKTKFPDVDSFETLPAAIAFYTKQVAIATSVHPAKKTDADREHIIQMLEFKKQLNDRIKKSYVNPLRGE
jgi:hypothetical protein